MVWLCVAQLLEVVEQNLKLPYTKPAILTANLYKDMCLDTVMSLRLAELHVTMLDQPLHKLHIRQPVCYLKVSKDGHF